MKRIGNALATATAVLLLPACSDSADITEPEPIEFRDALYEVVVERDIVYGTGEIALPPGQKDLLLDLYKPATLNGPDVRPGIVLIHGGGFTRGSKTDPSMTELGHRFAEIGYVAVSIDYRLTGDAPTTEDLATEPNDSLKVAAAAARVDAALAVQWLRDHAAAYDIDPNRIAIAGYSAGAITALGVTYWAPGVQHAEVSAVFSLSGGLYGSEGQVDAGEPPALLIHGELDGAKDQHEAFAARADEVGLTYEMYELPGLNHQDMAGSFDTPLGSTTVWGVIVDFMFDHLDLRFVFPDELAPDY